MKKLFTLFAAVLFALNASAGFGILVNGKMYYAGQALSEKDYQGRDQYKASVSLAQGDKWCIYDDENKAPFTIEMESGDGSAKAKFTEGAEYATCKEAGCYDFYIKLKWEDNSLWVQSGSTCNATGVDISSGQGGDQGGGQGGGTGVEGNPRFYYKMYTKSDDTWHEPSEETIFDHGVAEVIDYTGEAYVFVLFQVDGQGGVQYRTEEFMDATHRSVKLVKEGPKDWQLPAGVTNLYLYDDGNDTYTLSADPIPGKKLADPQPVNQGIDETAAPTKARKVIIDGQLRILRGDKVFDATGRQIE